MAARHAHPTRPPLVDLAPVSRRWSGGFTSLQVQRRRRRTAELAMAVARSRVCARDRRAAGHRRAGRDRSRDHLVYRVHRVQQRGPQQHGYQNVYTSSHWRPGRRSNCTSYPPTGSSKRVRRSRGAGRWGMPRTGHSARVDDEPDPNGWVYRLVERGAWEGQRQGHARTSRQSRGRRRNFNDVFGAISTGGATARGAVAVRFHPHQDAPGGPPQVGDGSFVSHNGFV